MDKVLRIANRESNMNYMYYMVIATKYFIYKIHEKPSYTSKLNPVCLFV